MISNAHMTAVNIIKFLPTSRRPPTCISSSIFLGFWFDDIVIIEIGFIYSEVEASIPTFQEGRDWGKAQGLK